MQVKKAIKFARHTSLCDIDSGTHIAMFVSVKNGQSIVVYNTAIIQNERMPICNLDSIFKCILNSVAG